MNESSKVPILSDKDSPLTARKFYQGLVFCSPTNLHCRKDVVTHPAQRSHYGKVATLIGQESQLAHTATVSSQARTLAAYASAAWMSSLQYVAS